MASGGDELVKYITEKIVVFIEDPRSSIRSHKEMAKQPWSEKWFGMIPMGWSIWRGNWPRKEKDSVSSINGHDA
ncbi:hypothetical protein A8L34_12315 [Bacillus sp. FJAT-27264]|uniref:YqzE family protein n=1 Tax=Paenibacillus sp. (strain DSM 101736 / FJAT-27264) TaxID=1850362 RepID=UPI000807DE7F|nr:YqzE family protein [Bacillus sp. FJAT-27264]OBZ14694.1 hypothetical protein A8L34_12315 [Bacillus sp. FJAT-27264]